MSAWSNPDTPAPPAISSYFYAADEKAEGPFDLIELAAQLRYGNIASTTRVRREGEETWRALQDMPEYPEIREISIETIARHLEEKARDRPTPLSPARIGSALSGLGSIVITVALAVGSVTLLSWYQGSAPPPHTSESDAARSDTWIKIEGERFSIECPVPLDREKGRADIDQEFYRAAGPGYTIDVHVIRNPITLPGFTDEELINGVHHGLMNRPGRKFVSEHFLTEQGHMGLDVFYTDEANGKKYEGGYRLLAGGGWIAFASYEADPARLHPGDIARFLNSFHVQ